MIRITSGSSYTSPIDTDDDRPFELSSETKLAEPEVFWKKFELPLEHILLVEAFFT